jgi:2Fe-2S iron-sulfur cluster binding domain
LPCFAKQEPHRLECNLHHLGCCLRAGAGGSSIVSRSDSGFLGSSLVQPAVAPGLKIIGPTMLSGSARQLGRRCRGLPISLRPGLISGASTSFHASATLGSEDTIEVFVNGEAVQTPKGSTVMQACDAAGIDIPRYGLRVPSPPLEAHQTPRCQAARPTRLLCFLEEYQQNHCISAGACVGQVPKL